jgi:hypothetical protein
VKTKDDIIAEIENIPSIISEKKYSSDIKNLQIANGASY